MAIETRVAQKEKLYILLRTKKGYESKGLEILPFLEETINYTVASMEAEDVAYVEKKVAENK